MEKDFEYNIYVVEDTHGNKYAVVCEEGCDTVQVCGMRDKKGKELYFETEAYSLQGVKITI